MGFQSSSTKDLWFKYSSSPLKQHVFPRRHPCRLREPQLGHPILIKDRLAGQTAEQGDIKKIGREEEWFMEASRRSQREWGSCGLSSKGVVGRESKRSSPLRGERGQTVEARRDEKGKTK
ncbi:hypothetical protein E2C01_100127 [Portunus trituberculatus]|uniref:Uncharacterized protein n=1 Tax=Portunus trituberculatus TaxID=210409 RepID=A0A5B7KB91_PORTR|nr:hypothetical protein [Portunus trituberculatus]